MIRALDFVHAEILLEFFDCSVYNQGRGAVAAAPLADLLVGALPGFAVGLDCDCYSVCHFGTITQDFQKLLQGSFFPSSNDLLILAKTGVLQNEKFCGTPFIFLLDLHESTVCEKHGFDKILHRKDD